MKGKERRENNARITRLWRGEGDPAHPCLKTLSDDLLLDNFHWSKVSDKEYDLFRAELVRRLNPNPSPSESRFNEIDNKLEQILYRSTGKTFQQIADDLNQNKTVAEFSRDINAHAALGKVAPTSHSGGRSVMTEREQRMVKALKAIKEECELHAEGPHNKTGNMLSIGMWAAQALEVSVLGPIAEHKHDGIPLHITRSGEGVWDKNCPDCEAALNREVQSHETK